MTAAWERYGRLLVVGEERSVAAGLPTLEVCRKEFLAELDQATPFARIVRYAGLDERDATVLALVAAVELDDETGRLASLSGEYEGLRIAVLRRLLGDTAVGALGEDAPLRCAALIEMPGSGPLGVTPVRLARRVAWALLGDVSLDPDLPGDTDVVLADDAGGAARVLVDGPDRSRRVRAAAEATEGLGFLVVTPPADERGWQTVVAQATVAGIGVIVDLPPRSPEQPEPLTALARRWLERATHLPIAITAAVPVPLEALPRQPWTAATPESPDVTDAEWDEQFPGAAVPARRPTADQLIAVAATASEGPSAALRRLASGTLLSHARRIVPRMTWDDLVLPAAQERRLHELVDRYRHRARVHHDWQLALYPSPGVVTLFAGASGTGKTSSAEVIAGELGVDVFRVDLSAIVSKYIGETEKNLESIFSAAHSGDCLLLFDEADSLFGARSAVNDARDRYANMEVSYLLQRLETYDGFVVLTSNFQGNIDEAFMRRIHASIHFPMPTPEDRERIWDRSLGKAPREDVDLGFLARTFELSGGSIRNAALTAAFLASGADRPVGMVELLRAVSMELSKLRQRMTRDQLGSWADELSDVL
jgi:AAA+ superfamily predicted ATPase